MPQIIQYGGVLLRYNPQKSVIEYSRDGGRCWATRYPGTSAGVFYDLLPVGSIILAATSKGIYYSRDEGRSWAARYTGSTPGTFQSLAMDGTNILATTSKGLFYSRDEGRSWVRR